MKRFFLTCLLILTPLLSHAEPTFNFRNDGVYISNISTEELENFFTGAFYDKAIDIDVNVYPRFFVRSFPKDYATLTDLSLRNSLFIKILAPIALKINSEILAEREELLALRYGRENLNDFDGFDCSFLEEKAKKYDVFTPFKDTRRCMRMLSELLDRVDVVPPSILIATAAIYTDWGTSRVATVANNLYMIRDWYTTEGLVSKEEPNEPYRFKIFPSLEESVRAYALKVNSNINYLQFWNMRKSIRKRVPYVFGNRVDWAFVLDNNLKNYASLLDYTIMFYQLYRLDEAELDPLYEFEN